MTTQSKFESWFFPFIFFNDELWIYDCFHVIDNSLSFYLFSVVNQVGFHRDQQCLASCSADKTLKLWDIRSHQLIQHYPAHTSSVTGMSMHPVSLLCIFLLYCFYMDYDWFPPIFLCRVDNTSSLLQKTPLSEFGIFAKGDYFSHYTDIPDLHLQRNFPMWEFCYPSFLVCVD